MDKIDGVITWQVQSGIAPFGMVTMYHGGKDGFVAKITGGGTNLIYGTNLGGMASDEIEDLALVPFTGEAVVVGWTASEDFPTTPGSVRPTVLSRFSSLRGGICLRKLAETAMRSASQRILAVILRVIYVWVWQLIKITARLSLAKRMHPLWNCSYTSDKHFLQSRVSSE
ncbi:MAG: hypothetical protein IPM69_05690 [Ignavibacteria bacterium]|nr:hypothetical protein [Ignavibacteria bacterium]